MSPEITSVWKGFTEKNRKEFSGEILFDEPLKKYSYYRIGGNASLLLIPKSLTDLEWIRTGLLTTQSPFFVMGQGSNLLIADEGFSGVVIRTSQMNQEITRIDESIRLGGGLPNATLLRRAAREGWSGVEFLAGVPGSIGGAVRMNAGTTLGETKDRLLEVRAFSFSESENSPLTTYDRSSFKFEYRKNLFLPKGDLVYSASLRVEQADPATVKTRLAEVLGKRKLTQPIQYPSCGSVFKNPKAHLTSAWKVIDELGLKGHQIGEAQISKQHANFIINLGNAKASDVASLIQLVKKEAAERLGILLEEEVVYLGSFF